MNNWNTLSTRRETALARAIFALKTLCDPLNAPILNFLLEQEAATLLDLIIATGLDTTTLEAQLDQLCQVKVLQLHSDLYGNCYQIDRSKIQKISALASQLAKANY